MTVTGCTIGQNDICDNQEVLNTLIDEYFKENLPVNDVVRENLILICNYLMKIL